MRQIVTLIIVLAGLAASGCATGLQGIALLSTAGKGAAPTTFSEFASSLQNYSADARAAYSAAGRGQFAAANCATGGDGVSSQLRENEAKPGEDETLPVAPEPAAIADLCPLGACGPCPANDVALPIAPGVDALAVGVAAPIAPGPEVVAGLDLEPHCDAVCQTGGATDVVTPSGELTESPKEAESPAYPLVAPDVDVIADSEAGTPHRPDIYVEPGPEPDMGVEIADAGPEYFVAEQVEVVPAPQAEPPGPFKSGQDDSDVDRFARRIADVPVDIRPTEGVMPGDLAASEFEKNAQKDPRQRCEVDPIVCSCTPWTICFRPLYFEEPALERLGEKCRFIQPAVSGIHFFSNVALLPYKMRLHPPRSCFCSNGFSRIGDPVPPSYREPVWRWDAAAVEAAAVTGFVFILP